jgi:hypothetical protein
MGSPTQYVIKDIITYLLKQKSLGRSPWGPFDAMAAAQNYRLVGATLCIERVSRDASRVLGPRVVCGWLECRDHKGSWFRLVPEPASSIRMMGFCSRAQLS